MVLNNLPEFYLRPHDNTAVTQFDPVVFNNLLDEAP